MRSQPNCFEVALVTDVVVVVVVVDIVFIVVAVVFIVVVVVLTSEDYLNKIIRVVGSGSIAGTAIIVIPSANTSCCRGALALNKWNTAVKLTFLAFLTFLGGLGGLAHEHPDGGGVGMMVGILNIRYISIFSDPCRLFSIKT